MSQPPITSRRKFNGTFKREAVNDWLSSGKSAEVIGAELGRAANRLPAWIKHKDAALREVRHLREQRDILKKNAGNSLRTTDQSHVWACLDKMDREKGGIC